MKVMLVWSYQSSKGIRTVFTSEYLHADQAILLAADLEKTGRTKDIVFVDEQELSWTKKEFIRLTEEIAEEPHDVTAFFDGSFDLETLRAGAGAAIYYTQNNQKYRIRANQELDEMTSNNEAEYAAFWFLLQELEKLGVKGQQVEFRGDSQVVLKQLAGEWPCYEESFVKWLDRIENKLADLHIQASFFPLSRKDNEEADQLASQAMNHIPVKSQLKLKG
ncbi:reverse transcriptase-like protein [Metabacillus sp. RGM 3146]|uniref:reverse transcriptase-like protein n=1 Tax=Metabacillus sp. RGM 3146 TaxID=3401092 RepID=UPI003B9A8C30